MYIFVISSSIYLSAVLFCEGLGSIKEALVYEAMRNGAQEKFLITIH